MSSTVTAGIGRDFLTGGLRRLLSGSCEPFALLRKWLRSQRDLSSPRTRTTAHRRPGGERRRDGCHHAGVDFSEPDRPVLLGVVDDHPAIGLAIEAATRPGVARPASPTRPVIARSGSWPTPGRSPMPSRSSTGRPGPTSTSSSATSRSSMASTGSRVIEAAARRGIRTIAFTSHDRASLMRAVFEAGGAGFLPKTARPVRGPRRCSCRGRRRHRLQQHGPRGGPSTRRGRRPIGRRPSSTASPAA